MSKGRNIVRFRSLPGTQICALERGGRCMPARRPAVVNAGLACPTGPAGNALASRSPARHPRTQELRGARGCT
ncbi:hypothetical protein CC85DRAFT_283752 [Cutaneotrichosporon oleaginosum]|uniref:Uncharacterized protein n=1 Tax=Cutaneotrichosporon oleaginosum TaxID=879819 RepID=A0A0J0XT33_9TREE|nr:uncharacterized protein CC85DRAFT_283752 [Cutaneotrichosporon oleaginosum]KLT44237.1 hypothetical protein CC85DRAFT_283752 [Cutaneotrichosporon oleaginosum]TXT11595.1 hypothetical protein COLE_02005 [Cutaneotrichosporon oleaginosum]